MKAYLPVSSYSYYGTSWDHHRIGDYIRVQKKFVYPCVPARGQILLAEGFVCNDLDAELDLSRKPGSEKLLE